ncbi:MAG: metal-dependent transcriptional regulator, partial [Microlunatus sp.]|nr:metal-dependent transcriptional regulator [Microlunatus sp.]
MVRVEEITTVAQDYLKVIWSATEWGGPAITTKDLAARFGTSQANVSETVKRLAGQNLVDYQPYKPVVLTPRGTVLALAMVRRHRLVETFLVTVLGYEWEEVHDEAERLEHAVSDTLIARIDQRLGHPTSDPHGDPIPAADGTVRRPDDTLQLG